MVFKGEGKEGRDASGGGGGAGREEGVVVNESDPYRGLKGAKRGATE